MLRRISGIAGESGYTHHPVVDRVERLQCFVVNRPVIRNAIERPSLEVRRVKSWKMCGVKNRTAADTIVVRCRNVRILTVDRIVGCGLADVRVTAEIRSRLPVLSHGGIVLVIDPVSLLEADNVHLGVRDTPGKGSRGSSGTDDQDIDIIHDYPPGDSKAYY